MTVASPTTFPGSRVLAGWWRELEFAHPRCLWVGYWGLHRVEGTVCVTSEAALSQMERLLLRFLQSAALHDDPPPWRQLSLSPALLARFASNLADKGLLTSERSESLALTSLGHRALLDGKYEQIHDERRVFPFLSTMDDEAAHFVPLQSEPPPAATLAWPDPRFRSEHYQSCFTQSVEWKRRRGFPENVSPPSAEAETSVTGQGLVVNDAIVVALALVQTREPAEDGRLVGFWIEPGKWNLRFSAPAFQLLEGRGELVPAARADPPPEVLRRAWHAWCQPRSLPPADVERCSLQLLDHRLVVRSSRRLLERLQAARSDALKGEAWILLGEGRVRRAALLEVTDGVSRCDH